MSYANPSTDLGIVNYSIIGDNINKSLTNIESARDEIITQQKEAQAILDEKFETVNDELATDNIIQLGSTISDKYKSYIREVADKEGLYNLSDQGYRDLSTNSKRIRSSVDKIAELASSNVELSKQFDDPDLARFIGAVRAGDSESIDVEFKDGKIIYSYEYDGNKRSWSGDEIIKESGKFEDISAKRDEYNKNIVTLSSPINQNIKAFLDQGKKYPTDNLKVDINSAIKGVGSTTRSYVYNEIIPNSEKSGLPNSYSSNKDINGRTLSAKEMAEARDAKNALIDKYLDIEFKKQLKSYPIAAKELTYEQKKAVDLKYAKDLANYQAKIKQIDSEKMIPDADLFNRISNLSKNTSGVELKDDVEYNIALNFALDKPIIGINPSTIESTADREEVIKFVNDSKLIGEPILSGDAYTIISDIVPTSDGKQLDVYGEISLKDGSKSETKREIIATIPLGGEGNLYPLIIAGRAKAGTSRIKDPTKKEPNSNKENPLSRPEWLKTIPNGGDASTTAYMNYRNSFNK